MSRSLFRATIGQVFPFLNSSCNHSALVQESTAGVPTNCQHQELPKWPGRPGTSQVQSGHWWESKGSWSMVVNNPLIRPYFLVGVDIGVMGTLRFPWRWFLGPSLGPNVVRVCQGMAPTMPGQPQPPAPTPPSTPVPPPRPMPPRPVWS